MGEEPVESKRRQSKKQREPKEKASTVSKQRDEEVGGASDAERKRRLREEKAKDKSKRRGNTKEKREVEEPLNEDSAVESSKRAEENVKGKKKNKKKKKKKKKKKEKDRSDKENPCDSGNGKQVEESVVEKNQDGVSVLNVETACLEQAENEKGEGSAKKTKKKKKKEEGMDGEKHSLVSTSQNEVETFGGIGENVGLAHAERDNSEGDINENKKRKEKGNSSQKDENQVETSGEMERVGTEHVKGDKSDGDVRKAKKKGANKEKAMNCENGASSSTGQKRVEASDQIAENKGKKNRKREEDAVILEESKQADVAEKREKKRRRKGGDNAEQGERQNMLSGQEEAGHGNNDKKKKKSNEEGKGKRQEENVGYSKKKKLRVSFADDVNVFPVDSNGKGSGTSELVHGKRFTREEDRMIIEAMNQYAQLKQLGEKGIEMILNSSKYPELRGCWPEIAKSLPHRPVISVYWRAHVLLEGSTERIWTEEEFEALRRMHDEYGPKWKAIGEVLGKNRIHVKDAWRRRLRPKNLKKGPWTQDELQHLFDLVNMDLRVKAHQQTDSDHRLLRDNISWEAISDKLTTRDHKACCLKWYGQLSSTLVNKDLWADADDYRLIDALHKADAVCAEDVDWDSLLDHRSGEMCRRRWNQMVRYIGGHREKPFIEQLEVLSNRYCPEMLEYRK